MIQSQEAHVSSAVKDVRFVLPTYVLDASLRGIYHQVDPVIDVLSIALIVSMKSNVSNAKSLGKLIS
jgi:hypothetical protein